MINLLTSSTNKHGYHYENIIDPCSEYDFSSTDSDHDVSFELQISANNS